MSALPEKLSIQSGVLRSNALYADDGPAPLFSVFTGDSTYSDELAAELARRWNAHAELLAALNGLLDLHRNTEMTHEDAYDAMFKSGGRDAWGAAFAAFRKATAP
jgi:hypothetical protein